METAEHEKTERDIGHDHLVHIALPPYEKALCGTHRNGRPLKPGAEVTCVVCVEMCKAYG